MNKNLYEHYFRKDSNKFDPCLFLPVRNIPCFTKPNGGFWASSIDSKRGWKQWCKDNFEDCWVDEKPFIFTLKNDVKILRIKTFNDIPDKEFVNYYTDLYPYSLPCYILDYEKLAKEYDGIEINAGSNAQLYYTFYGWDCDSICIFNPNIIKGGHYE